LAKVYQEAPSYKIFMSTQPESQDRRNANLENEIHQLRELVGRVIIEHVKLRKNYDSSLQERDSLWNEIHSIRETLDGINQ
jgi:hypothetical protein